MSGLKVLLMTSAQDDFHFYHYFPQSYEQPYKVNELLLYSNYFKNCGKGCLISKDKIYFYKTFKPDMESNLNKNKKKIFLFFYCDSDYKQKYIDEFTNNIFELLELDVFDENNLKKKIADAINDLFDIYKNIENKEEIYKEYVNNIMKNGKDDINNGSNNSSMNIDFSFSKNIMDTKASRKRENSLMSIRNSNQNFVEDIEMVKMKIGDEYIGLNIWDTAGTEKFQSMQKMYYLKSYAAFVVFDVSFRETFESVPSWISFYKESKSKELKDIIYLIGNKIDIEENREVSKQEAEEFAKLHNIKYYEVSAKSGENIEKIFKDIGEELIRTYKFGNIYAINMGDNSPKVLDKNDLSDNKSCWDKLIESIKNIIAFWK